MAMPATSPSSCQAPLPVGLPLPTAHRTRAGTLAFGRRLRGATAAETKGEVAVVAFRLSPNASFLSRIRNGG
jgi:hypothetical protein